MPEVAAALPTFEEQESASSAIEMLEAKWAEGKFLCVGLDVTVGPEDGDMTLFEKAKMIVDATHDIAAAYKPNSAFFERDTLEGMAELGELVSYIKELAPDVPVIWDAKRADIASTNEGYADAAQELGVDSITVHPYLGGSAVKSLVSDPNKIGFVLAHTSNPGAAEFQHLQLQSGEQLWERVVNNVAHSEDWQQGATLGIVTGATYPEELARARYLAGDDVVMLIPGVGTQGGDLEASVRGAMNNRDGGFLINVSSGISKAKDAKGEVTAESVRDAAIKYHEQIKEVWDDAVANPQPSYAANEMREFNARLGNALFDEGCIKFGKFTLKNGSISPVYVDLRASITDPTLRNNVANIYVDMIKGLESRRGEEFDVLAGIPQAATSYAAIVADRMNRRLVQPRTGGKKNYGAGESIMGNFTEGQSVGLIDDLITDGGAKLELIAQLEAEGLKFGGVAMLVDREQGGFREMAARGLPIIAATTLRGLVLALDASGKIKASQRKTVLDYLQK